MISNVDMLKSSVTINIIPNKTAIQLQARASQGDQEATEILYGSVAAMIIAKARSFATSEELFEELVSVGNEGFMRCIRGGNFNSKKAKWSTYVGWYIVGSMLSYLNKNHRLIRTPSQLHYSKAKVVERIMDRDFVCHESHRMLDDDEVEVIRGAIRSLKPKVQYAVNCRIRGVSYQAIGLALGVSKQRVQQMYYGALDQLRNQLVLKGVGTKS